MGSVGRFGRGRCNDQFLIVGGLLGVQGHDTARMRPVSAGSTLENHESGFAHQGGESAPVTSAKDKLKIGRSLGTSGDFGGSENIRIKVTSGERRL
jgi:hypothetical protein